MDQLAGEFLVPSGATNGDSASGADDDDFHKDMEERFLTRSTVKETKCRVAAFRKIVSVKMQ